ncbi:MAG: CRISPR system precrRNA processing endoribonuclease RAMP protein Cas6 [Acidobacteria bacterium]|nr:CRISPR system precrRNA processing endoribonuclease RAMP protein Cas6 [Acidobacteriota bacterium]
MFHFSKFQFEIELLDDNAPLGFWAPRLRGGYGDVLKREVCVNPELTDCTDCELFAGRVCDFPFMFKPRRELYPELPVGKPLGSNENLPVPYVISGPLDIDVPLKRGSRVTFEFVALGRTTERAMRILDTFGKFGLKGLDVKSRNQNLEKARFQLVDVRDMIGAGRSLRAGDSFGKPFVVDAGVYGNGLATVGEPNAIVLEFTSPVTLYYDRSPVLAGARPIARGKVARRPADFYDIMDAVADRVGRVWQAYGDDWPGQAEFFRWKNRLLAAAKRIEIIGGELRLKSYHRYSKDDRREIRMDGFTGTIACRGDFSELIEVLLIGELLHIGESTAFGFGAYKMAF